MIKYIKGFFDYRFLLNELVKKGIRLKYRRSYLGIIWSLIEPILTTIILVIVFGTLFNNTKPSFPLYIIIGRLLFTFFSGSTNKACRSIRANSGMIKKVYIPKYFFPLSDVLFNFVIFLLSLIVIIPVCLYVKVIPTFKIWHIIPALIYLLAFATGVSMILATLNVFFRDIEYLWNVAVLLIMYMSAIFYYPERIMDSGFYWILKYNPLFCIIDLFRSGFLENHATWWDFLYPLIASIVLLTVGLFVFKKTEDEFILHI